MKKKYVLRVGGLTYICGCRCRQNAHWAVPVEVRSEHPTGLLAQNRLSQGSKTVRVSIHIEVPVCFISPRLKIQYAALAKNSSC